MSALGVSEQRVNVVIDLTDPREEWASLGHGYRVDTRIVTLTAENVLRVPVAALFRDRSDWAVYIEADGQARLRLLEIGASNDDVAEVRDGLAEGDRVILHPGTAIEDGTRLTERPH